MPPRSSFELSKPGGSRRGKVHSSSAFWVLRVTVDSEILPDAVISHYRVVTRLGAGGMGEVWVGVDETLRRKVAMKAIRKDRRLDRFAKARFLREARILSQLDHPNICRVYDYIDSEHRDWLILELIEGGTLRAAIATGLTGQQRLRIALAIARVLVAMHAAGVVHRDLKPTNVMLTPSGEPKVLDFGLSAVDTQPEDAREHVEMESGESSTRVDLGASEFHSMPGSVVGTLAYMSPEQLAGDQATTASDMYSFGIVLEEMYTARAPSAGALYPRETPQPPPVPKAIQELIARLTATAPAQRPTAVDALTALQSIADAPRRQRQRLLIAAAIVVAIAGAAKYTWDLARERTAAIAARDDADRRRQQAESLIGFMVGDLRTRLTAVGRLDLLDEVGKKSLEYFDAVPGSTLTGEELFRRSQTLHQLGQVRQARADVAAALTAYEESLALAQRVADSDPQNATWQLGLGTSHFYVGDLKRRKGDLDGALMHFQAYQDIARKLVERDPSNVEWKLELSYGYSNVAAILSGQRKFAAAREQLELTREIHSEIIRIKPGDAAIQTSRANNLNRLGVLLQRIGEPGEAVTSFQRELEIHRQLVASDPRNTQFRRRIPATYNFLGQAERHRGNVAAATEAFRNAVETARELTTHDPSNAIWQRLLAVSEYYMGDMLQAGGRPALALQHHEAARAILAPIAAKNPGPTDQQHDLSQATYFIADALAAMGRWPSAAREADAAHRILALRYQADPKDVDTARALASLLELRGRIALAGGDAPAAARDWERAVELLRPLEKASTESLVLDTYVRALVNLGRTTEAGPVAERLLALGYREQAFMKFWKESAAAAPGAGRH
jgi:tetratricopeptide (TPR) repeat protein/tRNA A-37 threonylcarbamoyl transferase component Bud32